MADDKTPTICRKCGFTINTRWAFGSNEVGWEHTECPTEEGGDITKIEAIIAYYADDRYLPPSTDLRPGTRSFDDAQRLALELKRRIDEEAALGLTDRTAAEELRITKAYYEEADYPGHLIRAGHRIRALEANIAELVKESKR